MPAQTCTGWGMCCMSCSPAPRRSGRQQPQVEVATRHLSEPPEPPSSRIPQVDPGLDAVVLTALAKQPAQRYQSATELQDAQHQPHPRAPRRVLAGYAPPPEPQVQMEEMTALSIWGVAVLRPQAILAVLATLSRPGSVTEIYCCRPRSFSKISAGNSLAWTSSAPSPGGSCWPVYSCT
jgi:hypothetical protein